MIKESEADIRMTDCRYLLRQAGLGGKFISNVRFTNSNGRLLGAQKWATHLTDGASIVMGWRQRSGAHFWMLMFPVLNVVGAKPRYVAR